MPDYPPFHEGDRARFTKDTKHVLTHNEVVQVKSCKSDGYGRWTVTVIAGKGQTNVDADYLELVTQ